MSEHESGVYTHTHRNRIYETPTTTQHSRVYYKSRICLARFSLPCSYIYTHAATAATTAVAAAAVCLPACLRPASVRLRLCLPTEEAFPILYFLVLIQSCLCCRRVVNRWVNWTESVISDSNEWESAKVVSNRTYAHISAAHTRTCTSTSCFETQISCNIVVLLWIFICFFFLFGHLNLFSVHVCVSRG